MNSHKGLNYLCILSLPQLRAISFYFMYGNSQKTVYDWEYSPLDILNIVYNPNFTALIYESLSFIP